MASKATNPFAPGGGDGGMEGGQTDGGGGAMGAEAISTRFGGSPTGRPRADGLRSGSPEALAADREKSKERKRKSRESKRLAKDAPPLPSLGDDGETPVPALAAVPWEPALLEPVVHEMMTALEALSIRQITARAAKVPDAPPGFVETVASDASWNVPAKTALQSSLPQVACKWLNRSGISADNAPEVIAVTAAMSIYLGHSILLKKLDAMAGRVKPVTDNPKPEGANAKP